MSLIERDYMNREKAEIYSIPGVNEDTIRTKADRKSKSGIGLKDVHHEPERQPLWWKNIQKDVQKESLNVKIGVPYNFPWDEISGGFSPEKSKKPSSIKRFLKMFSYKNTDQLRGYKK